eukprot:scpid108222/ scgid30228/ 
MQTYFGLSIMMLKRMFEVLKQLARMYNRLVPLITSKLPKSVLVQLEIGKSSNAWSVKSLRDALSAYIIAREAADQMCGNTVRSEYDHSKQRTARTTSSIDAHAHNGSKSTSFNREGGKSSSCSECRKYQVKQTSTLLVLLRETF